MKGKVRIVIPYKTACLECHKDNEEVDIMLIIDEKDRDRYVFKYHQQKFPEDCIRYVEILVWPNHFHDRLIVIIRKMINFRKKILKMISNGYMKKVWSTLYRRILMESLLSWFKMS